MISLQQIINSSLSLRLVSALAQRLPPRAGYPFASFVADLLARQRDSKVVRAIRLNQWVATGETLTGKALDQVVRATLRHSARCLFDLYHYIDNPEATRQLIVFEPSFQRQAERAEFEPRGLMIVGVHLSNFDLILQWVCKQGLKPLAVTLPEPQGGRRLEYEIRKRTGMNIIPASVGALRMAIKHLQQGGMVVTGIDRPIPEPEARPRFFGRPAALPMHHIFLATKARVPVIVAVANLQEDEKYHVFASDPLEMDPHPDPKVAALRNAEKVLATAEEFIRRYPQQWSVPLPVWPQIMELVPE
jgi:KDO2-lipid IV(A) lauroyltransferase